MDQQLINTALVSQYKAALSMLTKAVEKTPAVDWNSTEYHNPNWQIAYHVLWSVKFYSVAGPEQYQPWPNTIVGAESLGGAEEWENPEVVIEGHHSKQEILSFIDDLKQHIAEAVAALPLDGPSGFDWYPYSRLELHINTIRHIQHHTAQIIERLKAKGITGFPWIIDENPSAW